MSRRELDIIRKHPWMRGLRNGLAAAGVAAALSAAPAEAQEGERFVEGGAYLGYMWGEGGGVTWGLEARGGADFFGDGCQFGPELTTAGVARFGFVDLRPQLSVGGQTGLVLGAGSFVTELSLGYRWGEGGGLVLPLGFELQVYAAQTYFRADPVRRNLGTGAGVFFPPRLGSGTCVVAGRALHDDEGHAPLPVVATLADGVPPRDLDPAVADRLTREWLRRSSAEWASVPAFLQLAEQLAIARAPRALVERALSAAHDELSHAVGTARCAVVYGGSPVDLGRVTPRTRAPAQGAAALRRLAVESWVDGCLGEGRAATAASREAVSAREPKVRELQRTIAQDEARHAALAWDVLRWAVAEGGDDVRDALAAVRAASPHERTGADEDAPLAEHGLLPESEHRALGALLRERALPALDAVLVA